MSQETINFEYDVNESTFNILFEELEYFSINVEKNKIIVELDNNEDENFFILENYIHDFNIDLKNNKKIEIEIIKLS